MLEFFKVIVDKCGVAGVMLCGFAYAAYWTAENVATPMVNRHIEFLDSLDKTLKETAATQQRHAAAVEELTLSLRRREE